MSLHSPQVLAQHPYPTAPWASQAWCKGADVASDIPHQFHPVVNNPIRYGYAATPWGTNSWAFVGPSNVPLRHQFRIEPMRIVPTQWLQNVDALTRVPQKYVAEIAARSTFASQFEAHIARFEATKTQFHLIVGANLQIPTNYELHVATSSAIRNAFSISVAADAIVAQRYELSVARLQQVLGQYTLEVGQGPVVANQMLLRIAREAPVPSQVNLEIRTRQTIPNSWKLSIARQRRIFSSFVTSITRPQALPQQYLYDSPYVLIPSGGVGWSGGAWPGFPAWAYTGNIGKKHFHQFEVSISSHVAGTDKVVGNQFDTRPKRLRIIANNQFTTFIARERRWKQQYTYLNVENLFSGQQNLAQQYQVATKFIVHNQWRTSLYNTTHFRVLWQIASDGLEFNNISASSQHSADFRVQNLKTDFLEQKWRATGSDSEWIQIDGGEGKVRYFDTIALLGHNLTAGAKVKVYGYGGAYDLAPSSFIWSQLDTYCEIPMPDGGTEDILVWCAPVQPTVAYRHWRVVIEDPANPEPIEVARFLGGAATIFTDENYQAELDFSEINFKDETKLTGFSGVANNRALRKRLSLRFTDLNMGDNKHNYRMMKDYLRYCRDTLKALVIPDPQNPYRYTVFAKVTDMPKESHRYIDAKAQYATMSIDWDESK